MYYAIITEHEALLLVTKNKAEAEEYLEDYYNGDPDVCIYRTDIYSGLSSISNKCHLSKEKIKDECIS